MVSTAVGSCLSTNSQDVDVPRFGGLAVLAAPSRQSYQRTESTSVEYAKRKKSSLLYGIDYGELNRSSPPVISELPGLFEYGTYFARLPTMSDASARKIKKKMYRNMSESDV